MKLLALFFKVLSELFYPSHCVGCECVIFEESRFCSDCWNKVKALPSHICSVCSHQLSGAIVDAPCENCADRKLHFVAGVSAFRHEGLVQRLLYQFKYGGDQSLKKALGELIAFALLEERLQGIHFKAVVPVPLHPLRAREREFNQAQLLAEEVAMRLQRPLFSPLVRIKQISNQARSNRKERMKNLQGAFVMKKPHALSGNYLLVDDVLTTGSTLDECAKVLLEAGAKQVWAVTVARASLKVNFFAA